jgi:hypothetical protein
LYVCGRTLSSLSFVRRGRDRREREKRERGARMSVIMEEDSTAPMERSKKGGIDYEALDRDIEKQRAVALEVMC